MRSTFKTQIVASILFLMSSAVVSPAQEEIRVGMIGLDTSHCIHFSRILNDSNDPKHVPGCRVVMVYPKGSPDIASSVSRVPNYTRDIKEFGVEVVNDLDAMVQNVDAVLLETNDGRPHLEQVLPVLKAGKPCFIDKPIAGSLTDCIAIFELAKRYDARIFSSSSLRFGANTQAVRNGSIGEVTGCDTYSPCALEKTHPDLFWYGIHGVESLFTVMGPGCESVVRTQTDNFEKVTGTWSDGRIGTFRGIRSGKGGYGGTAFGTKGVAAVGSYDGYDPLLAEIVKFFKGGDAPVTVEETINLYAFMEAADESKRQGGIPIKVANVIAKAQDAAAKRIATLSGKDR